MTTLKTINIIQDHPAKNILNTCLLSPPLTPTEPKAVYSSPWQPCSHIHSCKPPGINSTNTQALVAPFGDRRKQFVQDYSRMIDCLRTTPKSTKRATIDLKKSDRFESKCRHDQVFSLDVYGSLASSLGKKIKATSTFGSKSSSSNEIRINSMAAIMTDNSTGGKRNGGRSCGMLDKDAVHPALKRKHSMSDKPATKKKTSRVSRAKPNLSSLPVASNESLPSPALTRKEKLDLAAVFDTVDIDIEDDVYFPSSWIPQPEALDHIQVKVSWKGASLQITNQPYFHRLHPVEARIASTLRLSPIQYIRCKRVLIRAAQDYGEKDTPFRKSDAQKLCRVDVNKTSALWTAFGQLGWMGQRWPN
ncbi:hypothetical protein J3Q64DRAFT_1713610 [Phycomyces blakesleeanus]|uniref:SWIRM domain-containing protein n=2 Tax=Phycomyces blakesleeanus TaxID=4837 RepID=A0A167Q7S6_PHYB8|nr:hypothetical protein PHYBLDRAFT_58283 [Phycomyces blakesleeanus NRRL 1555(-)]OAD79234.1 hypothetical protein PHYBLDRAFT_58283 [Phycomyces blakesleeanus NRRL 1555(-)]|eukprot:XP_018297274.1 hypothetical protein PHYBLDRAFT_58283 [Phycomyces blakesleeanus NRRL 1555(-)]